MKRYWKLLTIVTVILLTIGTFYIQSSMAKSKYPTFSIKHQSGDESLVENLTIQGTYYEGENWIGNIGVSVEGMADHNQYSYLDMLTSDHLEPEIKRLQKEHRNFMRGKEEEKSSFFEDEETLAYVGVDSHFHFSGLQHSNFSFNIALLDKNTNKKQKMNILVPDETKFDYIFVEDVQIVDRELKIVTENNRYTKDGYRHEFHVYKFDISEEKLIQDDIIKIADVEGEGYIDVVRNSNEIGFNKYVVLARELYEETQTSDGEYFHETTDLDLATYNLETNEQKNLELPEEIKDGFSPIFYLDELIYLSKIMEDQYEILIYDVEKQHIESKQTFDLLAEREEGHVNTTFDKDYIYMINPEKSRQKDASIIIRDVKTADLLYEGSIEVDDTVKKDYLLYIDNIRIE